MDGLIQRFRKHVALCPDAIAVEDDSIVFTFQQLDQSSNLLAHEIRSRAHSGNIAICIPRSAFLLVSVLAIVKAGFAYVPLDPSAPLARLDDQVSQTDAPLLLVASGLLVDQPNPVLGRALTLDVVPIVTRESVSDVEQLVPPDVRVDNTALLAVLFTSGTTGRPKGVLIEHTSMINLVDGPTLEILPGDHVALTANPSFDAASFEIWNSLVHGATIFVLTAHLADTDAVVSFFRKKQIHKAFLPTAVFHRLFSDPIAAASLGATLRMINIGGEKLTTAIVKSFLRHAPHTRLTNGYGSAETTVCATLFEVTQEALEFDDSVGRPIPIGRPIPNTLFFLLDDDLHPVKFGHPGEICIGGAALARGYLDSSQVSSAKFTTAKDIEGPGTITRIYRTGDIGKLVSSIGGPVLEYVGRNDNQIKIRGQRLEPAEVEAVLCDGIDGAGEAAVVVTDDDKMIAYVVRKHVNGDEGAADDAKTLAFNEEAWDAFHAQYDWENISPSLMGADFTGWVSMYDGIQIPHLEMQDWLADTLKGIPVKSDDSVLEIGCGSGMILFSLEPHCREYIGIDMSGPSLAFVQTQVERCGLVGKVQTIRGTADQLPHLLPAEKRVDLIIINSVVQYFPSQSYLENVLCDSVGRVNNGGCIFLGDLRSVGLDVHHDLARVIHCDPSSDLSASEIQKRLDLWQNRQVELKINPSFFFQLQKRPGSRISHIEILPKMMSTCNELSQFRYQVVLHIGSQPPTLITPTHWMESTTPSDLHRVLATSDEEVLAVCGIPNSFVAEQEEILRLLRMDRPPSTASELIDAARTSEWCARALSPRELTSIAAEYGWRFDLSWKSLGVDRTLAAVFARAASDIKADFGSGALDNEPTNMPLNGSLGGPRSDPGGLAATLRARCRERLPAYMVPDHVIVKDSLPLTGNGKVDRILLARRSTWVQDVELQAESVEACRPKNDTQARIQRCLGDILEIDHFQIPLDIDLTQLGLHSFRAPQVLASLRSEFGLETLLYTTIYKYPSVAALGAHIDEQLISQLDISAHSPTSRGECERRKVEYDRGALDEVLRTRGLTVDDVEDVYETTATQKMCLRDPLPMAHELWTAHTDLDTLLRALDIVISRHGMLRTTIFDHGTRQVVFRHSSSLRNQVVTVRPAADIQEIRTMLLNDARYTLHPPDNLFRLEIYQSDPLTVLCYFEQATIDAWSRDLLLTEIDSVASGHTLAPPVPFRSFVDYEITATKSPTSVSWLASRLAGVDAIPFPIDDTTSGYATSSVLGPNIQQKEHIFGLDRVLQAFGIEPSVVLKAAIALVVRNETKRDSVAFGQIHFCRNVPVEGISQICGLTLSPLVDCVDFRPHETVLDLLHRIQADQHELMDKSLVDIEEAQRVVGRDLTPFFRFAWSLRSEQVSTRQIMQPGPTGFDTDLAIAWTTIVDGEQVKVEIDYDPAFSERIRGYVDQFFRAAHWLTANVKADSVDEVQLSDAVEQRD